MPTPLPGMDPYLERPALWPNVHSSLIVAIRDDLAPRLRPRYYVSVEERVVTLGVEDLPFAARPDVAVIHRAPSSGASAAGAVAQTPGVVTVELPMPEEMREVYLEIREVDSERVITVVEVLSPTNKLTGTGRRQYEQRRLGVLGLQTHLIEIDLLRAGTPMTMLGFEGRSDYRILVSRAEKRPLADLFPFSVRQPIPVFRLPLQPGDEEPELDLNHLLHTLYDRAGYDLRIDYHAEPEPPLAEADAAWLDTLLREAGLRG